MILTLLPGLLQFERDLIQAPVANSVQGFGLAIDSFQITWQRKLGNSLFRNTFGGSGSWLVRLAGISVAPTDTRESS